MRQLCAQLATDPVARNAGPDRLAHYQAHGWRAGAQGDVLVHYDSAAPGTLTRPDDGGEVGRAPQAVLARQHLSRNGCLPAQADSSPRPLRRRAEMMARPARVRIRSRKPCVLARRRLFG